MRIGAPAYFSPSIAPDEWARLERLPAGSIAIVNPDSGPAAGMSAEYGSAVRALRRRGALVYGYIDLAYGANGNGRVLRAAAAYRRQLGLDGVFLDQAPHSPSGLAPSRRLSWALRGLGLRTAINPGRALDDHAVARWFDEVVVFEGHWSDYRRLPVDFPSTADGGRWHLVYGVPEAATAEAVARAQRHGAGVLYVTDGDMPNPWLRLPDAWISLIGLAGAPAHPALRAVRPAPILLSEP
jgi:Spherulation-specific family 4